MEERAAAGRRDPVGRAREEGAVRPVGVLIGHADRMLLRLPRLVPLDHANHVVLPRRGEGAALVRDLVEHVVVTVDRVDHLPHVALLRREDARIAERVHLRHEPVPVPVRVDPVHVVPCVERVGGPAPGKGGELLVPALEQHHRDVELAPARHRDSLAQAGEVRRVQSREVEPGEAVAGVPRSGAEPRLRRDRDVGSVALPPARQLERPEPEEVVVVTDEAVEVSAVVELLWPDREAGGAPRAAAEQVPPDVRARQVDRLAGAIGEVARVRLQDAQRARSPRVVRGLPPPEPAAKPTPAAASARITTTESLRPTLDRG